MTMSTKRSGPVKSAEKPAGPPTWAYWVAALVAVGTLSWAVFKDTVLKPPEPVQTPVAPAAVQQSATAQGGGTAINAAGNASVSVGSGASSSPASPSAAVAAKGKDSAKVDKP